MYVCMYQYSGRFRKIPILPHNTETALNEVLLYLISHMTCIQRIMEMLKTKITYKLKKKLFTELLDTLAPPDLYGSD